MHHRTHLKPNTIRNAEKQPKKTSYHYSQCPILCFFVKYINIIYSIYSHNSMSGIDVEILLYLSSDCMFVVIFLRNSLLCVLSSPVPLNLPPFLYTLISSYLFVILLLFVAFLFQSNFPLCPFCSGPLFVTHSLPWTPSSKPPPLVFFFLSDVAPVDRGVGQLPPANGPCVVRLAWSVVAISVGPTFLSPVDKSTRRWLNQVQHFPLGYSCSLIVYPVIVRDQIVSRLSLMVLQSFRNCLLVSM